VFRIQGLEGLFVIGRVGHDLDSIHQERAGKRVLIPVDEGIAVVYQGIPLTVDRPCRVSQHVLDVQQIQQAGVQRIGVPLKERCDAVVGELGLRRDPLHVLDVLERDDRIVATHVLQAIQHSGVGVQGLFVVAHVGGDAVQFLIGQQPVYGLWAVIQERRVGTWKESAADDV